MLCPLCGAKNLGTLKRCQLCDAPLKQKGEYSGEASGHIALDSVDASRMTISWSRVFAALSLLAFVLLPCFMLKDLLEVPSDVQTSREGFNRAKKSYFTNREHWDQQKDQVLQMMARHSNQLDSTKQPLTLSKIPAELIISYLVDELSLGIKDQSFTLFPIQKGSESYFILSKFSRGLWPLKIPVSMDILVESQEEGLEVRCVRLRRGTRSESPEWAWDFFSPELSALRRLESYVGGVRNFLVHHHSQETPNKQEGTTELSWDYQHKKLL